MTDTKELLRKLIVDDKITDVKQLITKTGLSRNRVYELRKELGLNQVVMNVLSRSADKTAKAGKGEVAKPAMVAVTIPTTPEQSRFIPETNGYIKRRILGKSDIALIEKIYEQRTPLLLVGETGSGKTHAIRHFCYEKKLPYMRVNFNGAMTPEDLIGQFVPDANSGNGSFKWVDGVLTNFVRNGGVFVVDEINSGNAEILFFLHPLLDDERKLVLVQKDGEVIHAHPNFWLVSTMNPDYEGTKPLNLALQDRFKILEFDYADNVEKILIKDAKLLKFADKLRALYRKGELSNPLSTRALLYYQNDIDIFGKNIAKLLMFNKFKPAERNAIKEVFQLEVEESTQADDQRDEDKDDADQ